MSSFFVICFIHLLVYHTEAFPSVQVRQGKIQGFHKKSYDGRTYSSFEGIPYAQPPVGELRFKEPVPASCWSNTLIANRSAMCSQLDETQSVIGSEDCLYLNVYVPRETINRRENLDVVVHIHGGSLLIGSPNTMALPDYVMDKELIMVAIAYRLGAAGFLNIEDQLVSGNNGFKDQVLALKWIQENIKNFGGNPNSVTITGFSSGASSVQYHYISPMSKGLFHRGLSTSYTVTSPGALTLVPKQKANELAEQVKCPTDSPVRLVECLKRVPIDDLVKANVWFKPSVEKEGRTRFLPDKPFNLLKQGKVYDVPWITSNTINESLFSLDSLYKNRSEIFSICANWLEWGKPWLDLEGYIDDDKLNSTLNKLQKFYLDDCQLTKDNGLEKLNKLMTHRHFHVGTDISLRLHAKATRSPVYFYLFQFITEDRLEFFGPPAASHGVDNKLLFKFSTNPSRLKPKDEKMMRYFTDFLEKYAKTGKPEFANVKWIPQNSRTSSLNVLEINSPEDIKMTIWNELVPRDFWNSLPIKENSYVS